MADDNDNTNDLAKAAGEPSPDSPSTLPAELEAKIVEAVPSLPEEDAAKVVSVVRRFMHSGPLPPPFQMREYDEVIENGADRIMSMAEREQQHRHECEKLALGYEADVGRAKIKESARGQHYALILAILFGLGSFYLGMNDKTAVACVLGGGTLVSLVTAFVLGRRPRKPNTQAEDSQDESAGGDESNGPGGGHPAVRDGE